MERDLSKFVGRLPYASELYGVHQPLLGWRSRLSQKRVSSALRLPPFPRQILISNKDQTGDGHPTYVFMPAQHPGEGISVNDKGEIQQVDADAVDLFAVDAGLIRFQTPEHLDGLLVRSIQAEARPLLVGSPRKDIDFWAAFWAAVLEKESLNKRFKETLESIKGFEFLSFRADVSRDDPLRGYVAQIFALVGDQTSAGRSRMASRPRLRFWSCRSGL